MSAHLRRLLAACAVLVVLGPMSALAAHAADYTDVWGVPSETGTGYSLVQNQDVLFATFYVYGASSQPIWYIGVMRDDGTGVYSGEVYVTAGSFFGSPYDPAQGGINSVGTVTFRPTAADAAVFTYNVGTVNVTKNILRNAFMTIVLGGSYTGGLAADQTSCNNPQNNTGVRRSVDVNVSQTTSGEGQIDFVLSGGLTCSMKGTLVQRGLLYSMTGAAYSCSTGLSTTADVTELRATGQGIEGKWRANVPGGCTETGRFAAVLK